MDGAERPTKVRRIDRQDSISAPAAYAASTSPNADASLGYDQTATTTTAPEPASAEEDNVKLHQTPSANAADIASTHVSATSPLPPASDPPLSKNQLKKLRKKAEWEAGREHRKVVRKEKTLLKRERKRQSRQEAVTDPPHAEPDVTERATRRPVKLPITIIIDCDFDDLMRDGERMSLGSQLTRSYSDNRRSSYQAQLAISSFGGKLKERFDTVLDKMHESWRGVRFLDCDFVEAAEQSKSWMQIPRQLPTTGPFARYNDQFSSTDSTLKEQGEVIYLTSEAEETLHELRPFSTYIIGGLVDKNREKGLCYRRATERGIKTAKLPIGTFLDMSSRKVLATNHVNQIMLLWLQHGDWGRAFMEVMPKRKGGHLKTSESDAHDDKSEPEPSNDDEAGESTIDQAKHGESIPASPELEQAKHDPIATTLTESKVSDS